MVGENPIAIALDSTRALWYVLHRWRASSRFWALRNRSYCVLGLNTLRQVECSQRRNYLTSNVIAKILLSRIGCQNRQTSHCSKYRLLAVRFRDTAIGGSITSCAACLPSSNRGASSPLRSTSHDGILAIFQRTASHHCVSISFVSSRPYNAVVNVWSVEHDIDQRKYGHYVFRVCSRLLGHVVERRLVSNCRTVESVSNSGTTKPFRRVTVLASSSKRLAMHTADRQKETMMLMVLPPLNLAAMLPTGYKRCLFKLRITSW